MQTDKNILIAFMLNFAFSVFEFIGGIFTGSVAIVSDAVHDMGDAASIGISYFLEKKSKMEESFFTGLKNVYPQLTRKEAERQYHEVYSMIEKELKDLRIAPAIERKTPQRKDFSMEW